MEGRIGGYIIRGMCSSNNVEKIAQSVVKLSTGHAVMLGSVACGSAWRLVKHLSPPPLHFKGSILPFRDFNLLTGHQAVKQEREVCFLLQISYMTSLIGPQPSPFHIPTCPAP